MPPSTLNSWLFYFLFIQNVNYLLFYSSKSRNYTSRSQELKLVSSFSISFFKFISHNITKLTKQTIQLLVLWISPTRGKATNYTRRSKNLKFIQNEKNIKFVSDIWLIRWCNIQLFCIFIYFNFCNFLYTHFDNLKSKSWPHSWLQNYRSRYGDQNETKNSLYNFPSVQIKEHSANFAHQSTL